ncbi:hypothetical protein CVT26_006081 [Gymnopilus dilepis]|uniref:CCL2-like lectin domain-containing protein n=1 Tax=Gymnopilus dilepis TaxID=231916 RepID=A0A409VQA1_9AGAR|nr:hypothetical protein CVT26_006081 [Gymnopilus dilepis]
MQVSSQAYRDTKRSSQVVEMSRPAPGCYAIYNRVLSPTGEKLAITYNGKGNTLTVTPFRNNSDSQIWQISNYDSNTQAVVPNNDGSLQVGWGNAGAVVLPAHAYVWTIRSGYDGFTIQDGGKTQNWHLNNATDNALVAIAPDQGSERYRWVLEELD